MITSVCELFLNCIGNHLGFTCNFPPNFRLRELTTSFDLVIPLLLMVSYFLHGLYIYTDTAPWHRESYWQ